MPSASSKPAPKPGSFTYQIDETQGDKLKNLVLSMGFELHDLNYGHFSARKGKCSVNYYLSGKVVIQGKEARDFITFHFEPEITGEARLGYEEQWNPEMFQPHFGIDEAGKGDFFGPLVIAGAFVDGESCRALMDAGIKDSKRVGSDKVVKDLADRVREIVGAGFSVIAIGPAKYNQLYRKFGNLNHMLAWGHAQVIANLQEKCPHCPRALSDRFAHPSLIERDLKRRGIGIELEQRTKAESDTAVAAASILARAHFVVGLESLDPENPLPKGAGEPVRQRALEIAKMGGDEALRQVSKEHFKTFPETISRVCG